MKPDCLIQTRPPYQSHISDTHVKWELCRSGLVFIPSWASLEFPSWKLQARSAAYFYFALADPLRDLILSGWTVDLMLIISERWPNWSLGLLDTIHIEQDQLNGNIARGCENGIDSLYNKTWRLCGSGSICSPVHTACHKLQNFRCCLISTAVFLVMRWLFDSLREPHFTAFRDTSSPPNSWYPSFWGIQQPPHVFMASAVSPPLLSLSPSSSQRKAAYIFVVLKAILPVQRGILHVYFWLLSAQSDYLWDVSQLCCWFQGLHCRFILHRGLPDYWQILRHRCCGQICRKQLSTHAAVLRQDSSLTLK